jgi:hypothetical protein
MTRSHRSYAKPVRRELARQTNVSTAESLVNGDEELAGESGAHTEEFDEFGSDMFDETLLWRLSSLTSASRIFPALRSDVR